jgi:hypothetical protein
MSNAAVYAVIAAYLTLAGAGIGTAAIALDRAGRTFMSDDVVARPGIGLRISHVVTLGFSFLNLGVTLLRIGPDYAQYWVLSDDQVVAVICNKVGMSLIFTGVSFAIGVALFAALCGARRPSRYASLVAREGTFAQK